MILEALFWLRWLLLPVGLATAVWMLVDLAGPLRMESVAIPWLHAAVALALNLVYVSAYALMWHAVSVAHGVHTPVGASMAAYLYSNLGKYLPLKVAVVALRIAIYARRFQADTLATSNAIYFEALAALLGGFCVGLVLFPSISDRFAEVGGGPWRYALALAALLVLLLPASQRLLLDGISRILKRERSSEPVAPRVSIALIGGYAACWILLGTTLYVLCAGFGAPAGLSTLELAIEVYVVAGVAGMVSFFVPAGIGVREGVMVAGLAPMLGVEQSIVVALLARILISIAEVFGIAWGFYRLDLRGLQMRTVIDASRSP